METVGKSPGLCTFFCPGQMLQPYCNLSTRCVEFPRDNGVSTKIGEH